METQHLIEVFEVESQLLDSTLRWHPQLRPLFAGAVRAADHDAVRRAYLQLLKLKLDYVQYTVPALRAAGTVYCATVTPRTASGARGSSPTPTARPTWRSTTATTSGRART
jgi:hypothetical protein